MSFNFLKNKKTKKTIVALILCATFVGQFFITSNVEARPTTTYFTWDGYNTKAEADAPGETGWGSPAKPFRAESQNDGDFPGGYVYYGPASAIKYYDPKTAHNFYTPEQCLGVYKQEGYKAAGYAAGNGRGESASAPVAERMALSAQNQNPANFTALGGGVVTDGQIYWNVKNLAGQTLKVNTLIEMNTQTVVNGRAETFFAQPLASSTKSEVFIVRYNPGADKAPNTQDDFVTGAWMVRFDPAEAHGCGGYDLQTVDPSGSLGGYGVKWISRNDSNSAYFSNPAEFRGDGTIQGQPQLAKMLGIAITQRNAEAAARGDLQAAPGLNPNDLSKVQNGQAVGDDGSCIVGAAPFFHPLNCITQLLYYIMYAFMWLAGWIATLFDFVFAQTVLGMSDWVKKITAINIAWKTFRDLANIFFIFALIYASIGTILQLHSYNIKQLISKLIIAALLINFSLFFTKAIIDVSNIIAVEFYSHIKFQGGTLDPTIANSSQSELGTAMLSMFRLQTFYSDSKGGANVTDYDKDPARGFARTEHPFILFGMGIIFAFFFTITMLAATVTFAMRFVTFVALMILSPLAFVAPILPNAEHQASEWWGALMKEVIYAPAFMMMVWVVLRIGNDQTFKDSLGLGQNTFSTAITDSPRQSAMGVILSFVILIAMLIGTITLARTLGVRGSETSMAWFNKMRSKGTTFGKGVALALPQAIFRNKVAHTLEERLESSEHGVEHKKLEGEKSILGFLARNIGSYQSVEVNGKKQRKFVAATKVTHAAADFSFGGKSGVDSHGNPTGGAPFTKSLSTRTKQFEKIDDANIRELRDSPDQLAEYIKNISTTGRVEDYDRAKRMYELLTPKEQAVQDHFFDKFNADPNEKNKMSLRADGTYFKSSASVTQDRKNAKEGPLIYQQTEVQKLLTPKTPEATATKEQKAALAQTHQEHEEKLLTTQEKAAFSGLTFDQKSEAVQKAQIDGYMETLNSKQRAGLDIEQIRTMFNKHPDLFKKHATPDMLKNIMSKLTDTEMEKVGMLFDEKLKELDKGIDVAAGEIASMETEMETATDVRKTELEGLIKTKMNDNKDALARATKTRKFIENGDGRYIGAGGGKYMKDKVAKIKEAQAKNTTETPEQARANARAERDNDIQRDEYVRSRAAEAEREARVREREDAKSRIITP